jgi:hypothetical protein
MDESYDESCDSFSFSTKKPPAKTFMQEGPPKTRMKRMDEILKFEEKNQ